MSDEHLGIKEDEGVWLGVTNQQVRLCARAELSPFLEIVVNLECNDY